MAPDQVKDRKAIFIANDGFPVDQTGSTSEESSRRGLSAGTKRKSPGDLSGP